MNNYALSEDSTGKQTYVRFNSRAGESVTLNNVRIDSSTMQELTEAVSLQHTQYHEHIHMACLFLIAYTDYIYISFTFSFYLFVCKTTFNFYLVNPMIFMVNSN